MACLLAGGRSCGDYDPLYPGPPPRAGEERRRQGRRAGRSDEERATGLPGVAEPARQLNAVSGPPLGFVVANRSAMGRETLELTRGPVRLELGELFLSHAQLPHEPPGADSARTVRCLGPLITKTTQTQFQPGREKKTAGHCHYTETKTPPIP